MGSKRSQDLEVPLSGRGLRSRLQGLSVMSPAARRAGLRLRTRGARQARQEPSHLHPYAARHTATWEKDCSQRTSLERIFSRFDQGCRFERHYIRGKVKMETRVSIAMAIMMALAHNRADCRHQMRSLVKTWRSPKAAWPAPEKDRRP